MILYKLPIYDKKFDHSYSSSWYHKPEKFEWVRNDYDNFEFIVITNLSDVDKFPNKKVIGWIIEPPAIDSSQYEYAKENHYKFFRIFTYHENLLSISNKFDFLPIGGTWIENNERKIYDKNKNFVKSIIWEENTSLIFPPLDNITWHSYESLPNSYRITINQFLLRDI